MGTKQKTIDKYASVIDRARNEYPQGINAKEFGGICSQQEVSMAMFTMLKRMNFLVSTSVFNRFKIMEGDSRGLAAGVRKYTSGYNAAKKSERKELHAYRLEKEKEELKGIVESLPKKPFILLAGVPDEQLIKEMKARGFELQRTTTIKY